MSKPLPAPRAAFNLEQGSSLLFHGGLLLILLGRMAFALVWPMPALDWCLTIPAAACSLWALLRSRQQPGLRWTALAFGVISQALPVCLRRPDMLVLLLGAAVPVLIIIGMVVVLIRGRQPSR
ncbi:LrgA [Frateuria aurantia]